MRERSVLQVIIAEDLQALPHGYIYNHPITDLRSPDHQITRPQIIEYPTILVRIIKSGSCK